MCPSQQAAPLGGASPASGLGKILHPLSEGRSDYEDVRGGHGSTLGTRRRARPRLFPWRETRAHRRARTPPGQLLPPCPGGVKNQSLAMDGAGARGRGRLMRTYGAATSRRAGAAGCTPKTRPGGCRETRWVSECGRYWGTSLGWFWL